MRILMLNHNVAWRGGTFFRAYHFALHMAKRGRQVTLLTVSPTRRFGYDERMSDGVRLVETPDLFWGRGRTGWDPWDTLSRLLFVRRQSWDLVHAFDSRPAVILPALLLRRRGIPLVMDWADWWGRGGTIYERRNQLLWRMLAPIETFFEEAFRRYADGTTVISQPLYQRALSLNVNESTMIRIPQGSDVDRIRPLDQSQARQALGLPLDAPLLGHLGVLQPKDAALLLNAFKIIRKCHGHCKLIMIGNHRVNIEQYEIGRNSVIETGYVDYENLVRYLAGCDVLMLPLRNTISNQARWPSRINDYLAVGRPIITCPVGDVSELFREHNIGLLAPDNPQDFAGATLSLLEDQALREEMGFNARRIAEEQLSWEILTVQLEKFYRKILSQQDEKVGQGDAREKKQKDRRHVA